MGYAYRILAGRTILKFRRQNHATNFVDWWINGLLDLSAAAGARVGKGLVLSQSVECLNPRRVKGEKCLKTLMHFDLVERCEAEPRLGMRQLAVRWNLGRRDTCPILSAAVDDSKWGSSFGG